MSTLYFCIPEVNELAEMIKTASKRLPGELRIEHISDLYPDSFNEVQFGDLVVFYYHGRLADPNAKQLIHEYRQIAKLLDEREIEVGIFFSEVSDNARSNWPRPKNVAFEISMNDGWFVTNLLKAIREMIQTESVAL